MDKSKYQAILPLPYFHLGSENMSIEAGYPSPAYDLLASYYSGIPTMGVMMSRTSWQQTLSSIPLGLELYREPPVLNRLPDQRPLLLLENKEWHNATGNRFSALCGKGKKIHENNGFCLYELPITAYRNLIAEKNAAIKSEAEVSGLHSAGALLSKDTLDNYIYLNFDEKTDPVNYRGGGSLAFNSNEHKQLFKGKIPNVKIGEKYFFQFWLNVKQGNHANSELFIKELDNQGAQKYFWHHGCQHNILTLDDEWALVSFEFVPQLEGTEFEFVLHNKEFKSSTLHLDELMIYPAGAALYQKSATEVMKNGRWYALN
jgi:hypothetical protein